MAATIDASLSPPPPQPVPITDTVPDGQPEQVDLGGGRIKLVSKNAAGQPAEVTIMHAERRSRPGGALGSAVDSNNNRADFRILTPSAPQNLKGAPAIADARER